jgi:ABC-type uncharacterized transport system permease subunit
VLLGLNPASDVIAHGGGFVAGALLGVILNLLPKRPKGTELVSGLLLLFLFVWTAWLVHKTTSNGG